MTTRTLVISSVAALALLLSGAGLAVAHEMGQGQGMTMRQSQGEADDDYGPGWRHRGDDSSCPLAGMMARGKMMDNDMMGRGMMMRQGMGMDGGDDMMGRGHVGFPALLSMDEVKARFERMIAGNKRLKVAKVEPGGDFSFKVEITTQEGAAVHELLIDRRNGMAWEAD